MDQIVAKKEKLLDFMDTKLQACDTMCAWWFYMMDLFYIFTVLDSFVINWHTWEKGTSIE